MNSTTMMPDPTQALDPAFAAANAAYQSLKHLEGDDLSVAVPMLSQRLGLSIRPSQPSLPNALQGARNAAGDAGVAPKDFIKAKRPLKEIDRVACLAYFLVHYRSKNTFDSKDMVGLNTEARGPTFSNIRGHLDNATRAGFLTAVGGGEKGLTPRGEALVEALPDAEAVVAALSALPSRGRRKRKGKRWSARS